MFKRLLSALSGKKDGVADASPVQSKQAQRADREVITAYDADGRQVRMTRKDWRDKVFLPNLQQHWDDADTLYQMILMGMNDGHAADLPAAAQRLVEIDTYAERSHTMLGIVQMNNGEFDAAEATLRAGMALAGPSGILLTNLAKVFAERGDDARAEETLWQAVQADPNQENGLGWWGAMQRERGGDAAYLQAMQTAAALPGSWRPQLWLALHHLEQGEVAQAHALYTAVLAQGTYDRGALLTISAALGSHGQVALLLDLIGPAYNEHRDDPMTGLNLLRACEFLGHVDEGEAILARMVALGNPTIQEHLAAFAVSFQAMRAQAST